MEGRNISGFLSHTEQDGHSKRVLTFSLLVYNNLPLGRLFHWYRIYKEHEVQTESLKVFLKIS
jgi:hypothetical protein